MRAEVVHAKGWGWGTASVQQRRRTWEAPALWGCGLAPTGALWGSVLYTSGGAHGRESGGSGTSDRLVGGLTPALPESMGDEGSLGRQEAWSALGRCLDTGRGCRPSTCDPDSGRLGRQV